MSSFVIAKRDYIRVAGVVSGMIDAANNILRDMATFESAGISNR